MRGNNCGGAGGPAALACRAVAGVTSQLGRRGTGVGTGARLPRPTNDGMASPCHPAAGLSPRRWDREHLGAGGGRRGEASGEMSGMDVAPQPPRPAPGRSQDADAAPCSLCPVLVSFKTPQIASR